MCKNEKLTVSNKAKTSIGNLESVYYDVPTTDCCTVCASCEVRFLCSARGWGYIKYFGAEN